MDSLKISRLRPVCIPKEARRTDCAGRDQLLLAKVVDVFAARLRIEEVAYEKALHLCLGGVSYKFLSLPS